MTCCFRRRLLCQQRGGHSDTLSVPPSAGLAYHWGRVDLDQLLTVRLPDHDTHWSGGFRVDQVNAFTLQLRSVGGHTEVSGSSSWRHPDVTLRSA